MQHKQTPLICHRSGFTMVEILVCIAILSLLLAVTVPAVQEARRAVRATQCKSQLSQIGKAHHAFHANLNRFPSSGNWDESELAGYLDNVEQQNIQTVSAVLACPDDLLDRNDRLFRTSYLKNLGNQSGALLIDSRSKGYCGARSASDITDGLSQTACMSERLQIYAASLPASTPPHPKASMYFVASYWGSGSQLDQFAAECRTATVTTPVRVISVGQVYTHVLPPNNQSCYNGPYNQADFFPMIITPSSQHFEGAHVLLADGAVRPVSRSCDTQVWRALGSIQGGEVPGEF